MKFYWSVVALFLVWSGVACNPNGTSSGFLFHPSPGDSEQLPPWAIPSPLPLDPQGSPINPATSGRAFTQSGERYVPADFSRVNLELTIDNAAQETTGRAQIIFNVTEEGYPYFLLNASVLAVTLNGRPASVSSVYDPEGENKLVAINSSVSAGSQQELEITYSLGSDQVGYRTGGVGFVTAMADISSGNFFEDYGPANFEDDQFQLSMQVILTGVSNTHQLFSNGSIEETGEYSWEIEFPEYYNSSSFFLHLTDKALSVREFSYEGLTKTIPITVYSEDSASASSAAARYPALFSELERDYGPFIHSQYVVYLSGSGGMEHAGAAITSLYALEHELLHSWFGRGVMPVGGRSGWLDEAVASWRDYGYYQSSISDRTPVELDNQSLYDRFTPYAAYASGRQLMSELDSMFQGRYGGLRPLLSGFFQAYQKRVVESGDFKKYLEETTGVDLLRFFSRYVHGSSQLSARYLTQDVSDQGTHPPTLTKEEIRNLR